MGLAPLERLRVNRRTYWIGVAIVCALELVAAYLLWGVYYGFSATWTIVSSACWVVFVVIVTALCWARFADAGVKRSIALVIPISMAVSEGCFSSLHAFHLFDKDGWPLGLATLFYSDPDMLYSLGPWSSDLIPLC